MSQSHNVPKGPDDGSMKRVINKTSNDSLELLVESHPPATRIAPPVPNGGFTAWYQVFGSFVLFMNSWGIINSFGVYQTFYASDLFADQPSISASKISWIGSIQAFLLVFVGVFTGPLFDRGYFRALVYCGSFLVVFGMMMTSLCHQYWQLMLAQGVVVGIGSGCLFVPSVAILPQHFTTKKSIAQGIAASGSSLGGIIYPIVFRELQDHLSAAWATRVIAFIAFATLSLAVPGMKPRMPPTKPRRLVDWPAWKEPPFVLFTLANFFGFMGVYIPFYYIGPYSLARAGASDAFAFYILAILNAGSAFGRIAPSFVADKLGPLNTMLPCMFITCILAFTWMVVTNTAGLIVLAVLYGIFSGCFVALPPVIIVTLSPSLEVVGGRMGMSFSLAAMGLLIGNPIAGAILGKGDHVSNWVNTIAWCGSCATGCLVLLLACWISMRERSAKS